VSAGTVSNNIGTVNYSWKNSSNQVVGTSANVSNLAPDTYTLTVTDNCSSQNCNVTVSGPAQLPAPTVCLVEPTLCGSAGSVTITSTAPGAGVEFSIDNGTTWHPSNIFSNLGGGSVTGIKVKIGDCISPAANCSISNCAGLRTSSALINSDKSTKSQTTITTQTSFNPATIYPDKVTENPTTVRAYPNPFSDKVKFEVTSSIAGNGSLEIINMMGQKIKTVYQGFISVGSQTFELSLPTNQISGLVYVLRIGNKKLTGKLLQINQ
jgi:hypothetical protein